MKHLFCQLKGCCSSKKKVAHVKNITVCEVWTETSEITTYWKIFYIQETYSAGAYDHYALYSIINTTTYTSYSVTKCHAILLLALQCHMLIWI